MARLGVTYQDVAHAAEQLVGQGKQPTIESIRQVLGTGSSTTIANHLRQWRAEQDESSRVAIKENIPNELIAVMKGLWQRVIAHANEKISEIETQSQQVCSDLQEELAKYKKNNERWQRLYHDWHREKESLAREKLTLAEGVASLQKALDTACAKEQGLIQQLTEKQARIEELHRLHEQVQHNLEHYRESTREQRLLEQQQYEHAKHELQAELKAVNTQLNVVKENMMQLQQQHALVQHEQEKLQLAYDDVIHRLEASQAALANADKLKEEYLQASTHWQQRAQEVQQQLETKTEHWLVAQAQATANQQQLHAKEAMIIDLNDQNKLLAQEKWVLAQEKAQLEGQLKQMQQLVSA